MYCFVSDDSYFLAGIKEILHSKENDISVVHIDDISPDFAPHPGSVVVINVLNIRKRSRISGMATLSLCRVIFLLPCSAYMTGPPDGAFPWVLPCTIAPVTLSYYLVLARQTARFRRNESWQDWMIFNYISTGMTVSQLALIIKLNEKYLYLLKRKKITQLGLQGNSATVSLACRDILRLSVIR